MPQQTPEELEALIRTEFERLDYTPPRPVYIRAMATALYEAGFPLYGPITISAACIGYLVGARSAAKVTFRG